jgi:hypothetical protein
VPNEGLVNPGLTCEAITLKNACAIRGEKNMPINCDRRHAEVLNLGRGHAACRPVPGPVVAAMGQ